MVEYTGPIQHKRATSDVWASATVPLREGEIGVDLTVKRIKVGDGSTLFPGLPWATTDAATIAELEALAAQIGDTVSLADAQMTAVQADPESAFSIANKATIEQTVPLEVEAMLQDEGSETGNLLNARLLPAAPRALSDSSRNRYGRAPAVTILPDPIFTAAKAPTANLYWPQILRLDDGRWAMVGSSDHQFGASSGVWVSVTAIGADPRQASSWPNATKIIDVALAGESPETPRIFRSEQINKYLAFCQVAEVYEGSSQHTRIFQADNIEGPYTDTGKRIYLTTADAARFPGNGHTGYFNVFRIGNAWVAFSLLGGTDYGFAAIWRSQNGLDWQLDPRPIAWESQLFPEAATTLGGINVGPSSSVFIWGGRLNVIIPSGSPASGTVIDNSRRQWIAQLADDFRTILGQPSELTYTPQAWMDGDPWGPLSVFEYAGGLYTPFTGDQSAKIGLAKLEI